MDGGFEDLHVLGYGIDHHDRCWPPGSWTPAGDRERRAEAMAARLEELGFEVDPAPVAARRAAGKPVGRPHLAAAVLSHPANAERLEREGHADVSSFIPAYLIQGTPGLRGPHPPHGARGHPLDPRRRWRGDVGPSVLGHLGRRRGAGRHRSLPRRGPRRRGGVLRHAHARADGARGRALPGARPSEHGLLGLPRPRSPPVQPLPGLRPPGPRARARSDRRGGRRDPHARARGMRVAHRPLGLGQVHRGHARGAHAAGSGATAWS